jgi:hypothetical protein
MKHPGKTAIKVVLLVVAIGLIVAWEISSLFKYRSIERIGGHVAHMSKSSIGDKTIIEDGYSIRFDQPIGDSELATIGGDVRRFRRLMLDLSKSNVTNSGIRELEGATNIHSLQLENTAIGDEGLSTVATMTELVELDLTGCRVTDAGLPNLKSLKNLRFLYLTQTRITDQGLVHLRDLPALEDVRIGWGPVTPAGAAQLQQLIPHVAVARFGPPFEDRHANVRVTAKNGSPLPADGGPILEVCRKYFQAWQERDVYSLRKLSIADSAGWYKDISKEAQDIRPTKITYFSGFANETDATVIVGGPSREISHVNHKVQLKRENGQWKVGPTSME